MPIIELETTIKSKLEICFDLSRSIDLHQLSTKNTNEIAVAGKTSGLIGLNESVTWRATHFGIRQNLTSKITVFDSPYHFRDEQLKGIFNSFQHDHYFELKNERVIMKDVFEFKSPFGILGNFFNYIILTNYMTRLIATRNKVIKDYAETDQWKLILDQQ